jgi:hypothetical protein
MRKRCNPESDAHHSDRLDKKAEDRREQASAEGKMLDASLKRSIKQFGA